MSKIKYKRAKHYRNKKKIALIAVIGILATFFLVLLPILTVIVYNDNFNKRFETPKWMAYSTSDFEGLKVKECSFPSNNKQLLAGYQYSKDNSETKGVVVIAHGLGDGGHNTYMDIADYFTSNGYLVFAYDATGNNKSKGDSIEGLPQGIIDLDFALRYVKQLDEYKDLPIVLFGHSWGGYSVGNVLNTHSDIKAAVLVAGFDRSTDLLEQEGKSIMGSVIKIMMPYASLYEQLKFGKYATYSAIDGFANSNADIMIIHSKNDIVVLPENGYEKFYDVYRDNSRFHFIEYEDRGHNDVYYSEAARRYKEQINKDYISYVTLNGNEYNADIKMEFMKKYLDKNKANELDDDLMEQMLALYDSRCKES